MANQALETELKKVDQLLSQRSFAELVANCKQKVVMQRMKMETRQNGNFEASHKKCEAEQLTMVMKKKSGDFGPKTAEYVFTKDTFNKFNQNALRELLNELTTTPYLGQVLSIDAFKVHEMKEGKTTLATKHGYEDFNTVYVWLLVQTVQGEQQLHITLANDSRLSYGARIVELFFNTTALITVTGLE
jgi:hypothetical protein